MKVICIGSTKGGSGKTTTTINLAVAGAFDGKKVLIIDADTQSSSITWRAAREKDDIQAVSITQPTVHKDLTTFTGFDLAIIDCGGRDSATLRSCIMAADLLIIPVIGSQVDLWAAQDVLNILREARVYRTIPARLLLNQVITGTKIGREAAEEMKEFADDAALLSTQVHARVAYKDIGDGRGVIEGKDKSAAAEVSSLYSEIMGILEGVCL